jgi:hypothetical protein
MRNLYALLVAINHYHQPGINDLYGCLNDLEGMKLSLASYCTNKDVQLHLRTLTERKATRRAVINGFSLFAQAKEKDVCLFYFSGHGAQVDAPNEFWNETDTMLEALVCHQEKGNDNLLIDKELSYLIAEAQKGRDVHFVVITDSCHSGSNTKDSTYRVRSVPPNINTRKIEDFLGRADYMESTDEKGSLRLSPPLGKHIKLGACTSSEVAKERVLGDDGKTRGVFTYALLQVLRENGYKLSYANLTTKTRIRVPGLAKDQSPQLEAIALAPQECNRVYLNGLLEGEQPTFQVHYEEAQSRWVINVGHLYGIHERDMALLEDGVEVEIKRVFVSHSLLDFGPLNFHDRNKIYSATVLSSSKRKLNLAFTPESDPAAKDFLLEVLGESKSSAIVFDANKGIDYVVSVGSSLFCLLHPEGRTPVFSRIHGQEKGVARLFLKLVEQVAEWHHIVAIANPRSTIREEEIGIQLSIVENPQAYPNPDIAPVTVLENWQGENSFRYIFDEKTPGGPWHPPEFRLSITNRSAARSFWVSALYCGVGAVFDRTHYTSTSYSITNRFLAKEQLATQGQMVKLTDAVNDPITNRHIDYESIQLSILDDYFEQGYNEIKDVIKIFVATEEIDTSAYNLEGIAIDTEGTLSGKPAGRHFQLQPAQPDWRTFDIPLTIIRPRDEGVLTPRQDKNLPGITILGHPTFSARVLLSTFEEFVRSTKLSGDGNLAPPQQRNESEKRSQYMPRPEIALGNENVQTVYLTPGLGNIEGRSVIEFYRSSGADFISQKQPLCLKIDPHEIPVAKTDKLVLVGYSAAHRTYVSLATMDQDYLLQVQELPLPSPSLINGLGASIKLLLLSVRADFEIAPYTAPTSSTA